MLSFSLHQMKILNCSDRVVGAGSGADLKVWLRLHLKTSAPDPALATATLEYFFCLFLSKT